jgi:hypothetical protein
MYSQLIFALAVSESKSISIIGSVQYELKFETVPPLHFGGQHGPFFC